MTLYLGVDGGQSSTEAVIGDNTGSIIGRGTAGPCNHVSGEEAIGRFRHAMTGAVTQACREAGLSFEKVSFAAACFGLSGGPEDKATHIRRLIRAERYKITHDAEIALAGALAGQPGIIVIAGTGSMAFGRTSSEQTARAGGWGYLFGDEGGAWDIARRATRAALRMEEGWGPPTILRDRLLAATSSATANQMLHRFYTPEYARSRLASLAPLIDAAAEGGDRVACNILRDAAEDLAGYVAGVHSILFRNISIPVSYIGGVFESRLLLADFTSGVQRHVGSPVHPPAKSAAEGALLLALQLT